MSLPRDEARQAGAGGSGDEHVRLGFAGVEHWPGAASSLLLVLAHRSAQEVATAHREEAATVAQGMTTSTPRPAAQQSSPNLLHDHDHPPGHQ